MNKFQFVDSNKVEYTFEIIGTVMHFTLDNDGFHCTGHMPIKDVYRSSMLSDEAKVFFLKVWKNRVFM